MDILYRDEHLLAVHKPHGMLVHRSNLDRRETVFALQKARDAAGCPVYPVHRLDRGTSGVLLFALSPEAAATVAAAFREHRVTKKYLAVVRGVMPGECTVDHPLAEEREEPGAACGTRQPALTRFRTLASTELPHAVGRYPTSRYSLVEAVPVTGRRRQIRRHLKHLHHPIIGDTTYGDGLHNRFFRSCLGCNRMLLAAVELSLPHPATGEPLTVSAPPEEDFAALLRALGWKTAVPR